MSHPIELSPEAAKEKQMDLEFKIVACTFFGMFYAELVEKFAAANNPQMLPIVKQQMLMTQKLAMRFNTEYKDFTQKRGLVNDSKLAPN